MYVTDFHENGDSSGHNNWSRIWVS